MSSFYCRTLTGAWIETLHIDVGRRLLPVAPSRVRGLKQAKINHKGLGLESHPHGCVD